MTRSVVVKHIINNCKSLCSSIAKKIRDYYHNRISNRIEEKDISIISNDCIGGIIYHDLRIRFLSPTINLMFGTDEDYLEFLSNIKYYVTQTPIRIEREDVNYPVGKIVNGDKSVVIHFVHYKSFEESVSKWLERGKRINYDNIFVLWHISKIEGPAKNDVEIFNRLLFDKKLIITGDKCDLDYDYICKIELYNKDYYSGKILDYIPPFRVKRFLDRTKYYKNMS